jgi:O-antigen biosynthesis protein
MMSVRRKTKVTAIRRDPRAWRMKFWVGVARTWRVVRHCAPLRRAGLLALAYLPRLRRLVMRARFRLREAPAYAEWIRDFDTLHPDDIASIHAHIAELPARLISVVMPVYNTDAGALREAIGSVRDQLYPHWELCVADDCSDLPHVREVLEAFADDPRIRIAWRTVNGHISAATNSALALARGGFVALMDHDDVLRPHALYEIAAELAAQPETDLIYSDEDKIDENGRRFAPYCKPDWNHDLLLGQNYINHLSVFRRSLVERIGGMREGFEGSQDHDLLLRLVEQTQPGRIRHIPAILYHWRHVTGAGAFSEAALARCIATARQAVAEHLERTGFAGATVGQHPDGLPWLRVTWPLAAEPSVSIVVPTRNHADLLRQLAEGVLQRTDYVNFELVIVDNDSSESDAQALLRQLEHDPRVRLLRFPGPFNYSAINNYAVTRSASDVIVLLNNDIDVIDGGWLREMVSHAIRPDIGAVGAKLIYPDKTIQHAGVVLGITGGSDNPGVGGHLGFDAPRSDVGYFGQNALTRDISAVTAACLAVRRDVYMAVGGLDEKNLAIAFNDVDLCLRIAAMGLRNVWTPFAELYHLESASRGSDLTAAKAERFAREYKYMRARWGSVLDNDPFYNSNFGLAGADHSLEAPRRVRPWMRYMSPRQPGESCLPSFPDVAECDATHGEGTTHAKRHAMGQFCADPLSGSQHPGT